MFQNRIRNNIATSVAIYTIGLVLVRGLGFISAPIFTRLLSPEDYGITSTFSTWTVILYTVVSLYTQGSLASAMRDYKGNIYTNYIASILTLSCLCFLVFSILYITVSDIIATFLGYTKDIVLLLLIASFVNFVFNFYQVKLIYEGKKYQYLASSFGVSLSTIILSYVLIKILPRSMAVNGRLIGGMIPLCFITVIFLVRQYYHANCIYDKSFWKYCVKLSLPLMIVTIANVFLSQIAKLILNRLSGEYTAGIYSFANSLCDATNYIRMGIFNTWLPWYFNAVERKSKSEIINMSKILSRIFCVIVLGFVFVSPEVYRFLTPESYWDGIPLLMYMGIGVYFYFLSGFYSTTCQFNKKNHWISCCVIVAAIVSILMNYILVMKYGIMGAAFTSAISYIVLFALYSLAFKNKDFGDGISYKLFIKDIGILIIGCAIFVILQGHSMMRWTFGVLLGIYLLSYCVHAYAREINLR